MPNRPEGMGLRAAVFSALAVVVMLLGGAISPALAADDTPSPGPDPSTTTTQGLAPSADGTCTDASCNETPPPVPQTPPPLPTFPPNTPPTGPMYVSPIYPYATPATCSEPGHLVVPTQPTGVHETHSGAGTGSITFVFTHDAGYAFLEGTDRLTSTVNVEPRLTGALCHGTGPVYGGGYPGPVAIPPIPAPPPLRWTVPAMPMPPRWAVRYPAGTTSFNFALRPGEHGVGKMSVPSFEGHGFGPTNGEHAGQGHATQPNVLGTESCRGCTTTGGQVPTNVHAGSATDGARSPLQVRTALALTGAGGAFVLGVLALGLWRHRAPRG